ncbi:GLPGLI family protein [Lewinella sp. IMCC34191]|uniref:GLPGLI family protein n=1 Tax=Lewinella sp. IMCC34191 TaxID=2259172 RepID=UPI000E2692E0|nr:GLPGLI family protein [Lewinella sp. IMCC34191]
MNKLLLTLLLVGLSSLVVAKKNTLKVSYQQIVNRNVEEGDHSFFAEINYADLIADERMATYRYVQDTTGGQTVVSELEERVKLRYYDPIGFAFHTDVSQRTLTSRELVTDQSFIVTEPLPDLNWTIGEETKDVAGYACTSASVTFRGRTYVAWFTPELPLPFGPWKLGQLPGLILEASDDTGMIKFKALGIEQITATDDEWQLPPAKGKNVSFDKFYTTRAKVIADKWAKWASMPGITVKLDNKTPSYFELTE